MIDTDGIYDRCGRCGERCRAIRWGGKYGAECMVCPNAIDLCETETAAIVRWNREQRAMKGGKDGGGMNVLVACEESATVRDAFERRHGMSENKLQVRERDGLLQFSPQDNRWLNAVRLWEQLLCIAVLERDAEIERLRATLEATNEVLGDVSSELKRRDEEVEALRATLAAKEQTLRTVEDECAGLRGYLKWLLHVLSSALKERDAARAECARRVSVEDVRAWLMSGILSTAYSAGMFVGDQKLGILAYLARAKPEQADGGNDVQNAPAQRTPGRTTEED